MKSLIDQLSKDFDEKLAKLDLIQQSFGSADITAELKKNRFNMKTPPGEIACNQMLTELQISESCERISDKIHTSKTQNVKKMDQFVLFNHKTDICDDSRINQQSELKISDMSPRHSMKLIEKFQVHETRL